MKRGGSKDCEEDWRSSHSLFSGRVEFESANIYVTSVHFHVFQLRLTSDFLKTRGPFDFLKSVWN